MVHDSVIVILFAYSLRGIGSIIQICFKYNYILYFTELTLLFGIALAAAIAKRLCFLGILAMPESCYALCLNPGYA